MSLVYEALVLVATLMVVAFPFVFAFGGFRSPLFRPLFQLYLLSVAGSYFVWFWTHGGQTLPMKTWRLKLITAGGTPPGVRQATMRYLFAVAGLALAGLGFLWAAADRDRQFLHDRLAGTKIVKCEA